MDWAKVRAWWAHCQGLDGSMQGIVPASVLESVGWARSAGGANPYITLFSRAGTSRVEADAAVANLQIHELPSARGCTYVVPDADFALGLRVGQGFGEAAAINTARRFLGVTSEELTGLGEAVLRALESGNKDPAQLRELLGDRVRNLGAEGKKRGQMTTLPLALGKLQSSGEIRRVPVTGRLDQQRYRYALWRPSPLNGLPLTDQEAYSALAERYFRWIGPATQGHFQWFAGIGPKVAKDALAPLGLVSAEEGSPYLLHPAQVGAFRAFQVPVEPRFALVASIDNIILHRRDVMNLIDERDHERASSREKGGVEGIAGAMDLSSHAILDRGRLVGLWEFDPTAGAVVTYTFEPQPIELAAEIRRYETYFRDDLGDVRSFSLDSPESRAPRIATLRALSAAGSAPHR